MITDKYFLHGLHRDILLRDSDPDFGPTYIYRFSYVPKQSLLRLLYANAYVEGIVWNWAMTFRTLTDSACIRMYIFRLRAWR